MAKTNVRILLACTRAQERLKDTCFHAVHLDAPTWTVCVAASSALRLRLAQCQRLTDRAPVRDTERMRAE